MNPEDSKKRDLHVVLDPDLWNFMEKDRQEAGQNRTVYLTRLIEERRRIRTNPDPLPVDSTPVDARSGSYRGQVPHHTPDLGSKPVRPLSKGDQSKGKR